MWVNVITPSLNKSFKFQSEWPYNNSQAYLLQTIVKDINNDTERTFEEKDGNYIFKSTVNYSNNEDLINQEVYLNKDAMIERVLVYDTKGLIKIKMDFDEIDLKKKYDDDYFKLENNITYKETIKTISKIEDIIYPMYLPVNTYLTSQDKVIKEDGERIILTFGGDKSFTLIEETITVGKDLDVNITYGEPDIILDTVGVIDDNSISWVSNEIEYSLVSDNLDKEELISVAKSISSASLTK